MAFDLLLRDKFTQLDIFFALSTNNPKIIKLTQALDLVNERYGRGTIFPIACEIKFEWRDLKKIFLLHVRYAG